VVLASMDFWLINWIRKRAPHRDEEMYQKLGDLVGDGSLGRVDRVYPLDQSEAFKQSLKSHHSGQDPVPVGGLLRRP